MLVAQDIRAGQLFLPAARLMYCNLKAGGGGGGDLEKLSQAPPLPIGLPPQPW